MKVWQVAVVFAGAFAAQAVQAQTVSSRADISWTNPTTGCVVGADPPRCDVPLTGSAALTAVHVFVSTSSIPDAPGTPTIVLGPGAQTAVHTLQVPNGSTLHIRVRAANAYGPGRLSAEVTKLVNVPTEPGVPSSVAITLTVTP